MIFLESVFGCQRRDCPTKCGAWPNKPEFMPPLILARLISECKELNIPDIQLYGRGDVKDYPFHEVPNIEDCEVSITDISYYMAEYLRERKAKVYSRIDKPSDAENVPVSDGYFTVELPTNIYGDGFLDVLIASLELRPFAIKSLDGHMGNPTSCDSRAQGFPPPYDNPSRILSYTIPSQKCRIPLITYYKGEICYKQCVSGKEEYKRFTSVREVINDKKCEECSRFPKQKRIYYYE